MNIWLLVASGPSLDIADIEYARQKGVNIAACNMEFRRCPDAKIFFSSDHGWWETYGKEAKETLSPDCELWTSSTSARMDHGIKQVQGLRGPGFSKKPGFAHLIGLAGYTLIPIVSWKEPNLMLLTGFDTQRTEEKSHHYGDYPKFKKNGRDQFLNVPHLPIRLKSGKLELSQTDKNRKLKIPRQVECFNILAKQCPIKIINCSRETALTCFERATVQEVLG